MTPEELEARKEEFADRRRERERLKEAYPAVHRWLRDVLARQDPLGFIATGAPSDEYEREVDTLLPQLLALHRTGELSEPRVLETIHAEFIKWFGAHTAGAVARYAASAGEVYAGFGRELSAAEVDESPVPQVD
jgi:hypothetical protein